MLWGVSSPFPRVTKDEDRHGLFVVKGKGFNKKTYFMDGEDTFYYIFLSRICLFISAYS